MIEYYNVLTIMQTLCFIYFQYDYTQILECLNIINNYFNTFHSYFQELQNVHKHFHCIKVENLMPQGNRKGLHPFFQY